MAATLTDTGAPAMAAPVKILLVDDQPGRLLTYRTILEPLGEELVDARSGMEALKLLMEAIEKAIAAGERDKVPTLMSDRWLADCTLFGSATEVRDGVAS